MIADNPHQGCKLFFRRDDSTPSAWDNYVLIYASRKDMNQDDNGTDLHYNLWYELTGIPLRPGQTGTVLVELKEVSLD